MARFIPFVRSFGPFAAGSGHMPLPHSAFIILRVRRVGFFFNGNRLWLG